MHSRVFTESERCRRWVDVWAFQGRWKHEGRGAFSNVDTAAGLRQGVNYQNTVNCYRLFRVTSKNK